MVVLRESAGVDADDLANFLVVADAHRREFGDERCAERDLVADADIQRFCQRFAEHDLVGGVQISATFCDELSIGERRFVGFDALHECGFAVFGRADKSAGVADFGIFGDFAIFGKV